MPHIDEGTLHAYLDGELSEARQVEIEGHLATCGECQARLEVAEALSRRAGDLLDELEPGAVQAPSWREIEERAAARRRAAPRRIWLRPGLAWAASIALAFAIGWLSSNYWLVMPRFEAASRGRLVDALEEDRSQSPTLRPVSGEAEADARPESQVTGEQRWAEAEEVTPQTHAEPTPKGEGAAPAPGRGKVAEDVPTQTEREDQFAAQRKRDAELADEAAPPETPPAVAGIEVAAIEEEPAAALPAERAEPEAMARAFQAQRTLTERTAAGAAADAEFVTRSPEEAEVWMGAELRTLPDLLLKRVEVGPGAAVEGAVSRLPAIRLIYEDAAGHEIVLIQQAVLGADPEAFDTALVVEPSGRNTYRWLDSRGYLFILQAEVSSDSLRALAERLR